ncbi:MAG: choice-of-anchor B family protein [Saprospiraceae bacterium]|nr:choice-of-anchor B family protein [Saprospiraceae bacterium]
MFRLVTITIMLSFAFSISAFSQLNATLFAQIEYDFNINDVWGHVAEDGTEYALVGTQFGLSIVRINEDGVEEVDFIDGTSSTWRDIKTWDHRAYVSTEANDGLLVVDLQHLPDSTSHYFWKGQIPGLGNSFSAHNIYIDEFGVGYLPGGNLNEGGTILVDLTDPDTVTYLGKTRPVYSHDVYARNNLLYSSDLYAGGFSIQDVSDPTDIKLLAFHPTTFDFTHNTWPSDDGNTLFTTDERANAYVGAYDISDLDNIKELDLFRPASSLGNGVIPHNVHIYQDWSVTSYYTSGTVIIDISEPDNMIEVGNYDSFQGQDGGFNGCWGAYPYLPSGLVLMSDRGNGLFVFEPNYVNAARLEGTVRESEQGQPLFGATIEIQALEEVTKTVTSGIQGGFKTGKAIPGDFVIRVTKEGYKPHEEVVNFANGEMRIIDVILEKQPKFNITLQVLDKDGQAFKNANVFIDGPAYQLATTSDEAGTVPLEGISADAYKVYAGTWGEYIINEFNINNDLPITLQTEQGYYDDFTFDFGWEVSGNATSGVWEKTDPDGAQLFNSFNCSPEDDIEDDISNECFVTGNADNGNSLNDDVDDGFTLLSSPAIDLSGYINPVLDFNYWRCSFSEEVVFFKALATSGTDTVELQNLLNDGNIDGQWRAAEPIALKEFFPEAETIQLHFKVEDLSTDFDQAIEAAVDGIIIYETGTTGVADLNIEQAFVYPNPFTNELFIQRSEILTGKNLNIEIFNNVGQLVQRSFLVAGESRINTGSELPQGVYFLSIKSDGIVAANAKVIKL